MEEKQKTDILLKELLNKSEMVRFVLGPDCKIYPDFSENLPGRGMWVKADKKSLQEVIDKRLFNKISHNDCKIEKDFITNLVILLKNRVLNLLGFAKKSGNLVLGLDNVIEISKKKQIKVFLIASDSGEDGKKKLKHLLNQDNVLLIDLFTAKELQHIFGQDILVVYGCLQNSKITNSIIENYKKLIAFL
jgi:hypothetical protein